MNLYSESRHSIIRPVEPDTSLSRRTNSPDRNHVITNKVSSFFFSFSFLFYSDGSLFFSLLIVKNAYRQKKKKHKRKEYLFR